MITKIKLSGLTCIACKKLTEKRLSKISGVNNVVVELQTGLTEITADRLINNEEVIQALDETNYKIV